MVEVREKCEVSPAVDARKAGLKPGPKKGWRALRASGLRRQVKQKGFVPVWRLSEVQEMG
jgi:hypothetical protein